MKLRPLLLIAGLILSLALLLSASCGSTKATASKYLGADGWYTQLDAAQEVARSDKKPMMILFTGSDWCPPCKSLEKEVLSTDKFEDFAEKHFVLVKMDFPRGKDKKLSVEDEVHRDTVATHYLGARRQVPTVVLTNAEGVEFARTGYRVGGPDNYLKHLEDLLKRQSK